MIVKMIVKMMEKMEDEVEGGGGICTCSHRRGKIPYEGKKQSHRASIEHHLAHKVFFFFTSGSSDSRSRRWYFRSQRCRSEGCCFRIGRRVSEDGEVSDGFA